MMYKVTNLKYRRTNIYLQEKTIEQLKVLAGWEDSSMSQVIRSWLEFLVNAYINEISVTKIPRIEQAAVWYKHVWSADLKQGYFYEELAPALERAAQDKYEQEDAERAKAESMRNKVNVFELLESVNFNKD